ncbi:MAG: MFS transporter [Acidimicrobiales bacterium]
MSVNGVDEPSEAELAARRRQLVILAAALVLAMSTWFSTAAVLSQLRAAWHLSASAGSWLTIMVQLGFVAGAALSAATNLADRVPPRRLILLGTLGAATANAVVAAAGAYPVAIAARFATGACLAAVYPPSLKAMSSWYRTGRGFALGVMIGALTVGSALPHLINALGGLPWRLTLAIASVLTVAGGLIADRLGADGPYATRGAAFDPSQLRSIVSDRRFRLASAGYFGHMWELYAMWAWAAAFYRDAFSSPRLASLAAFAVIAAGAGGSIYAGLLSDRVSRTEAAGRALRSSAAVALVAGFLVDAPAPIVVGAGLVWGFWVVADSAQFSTIVTEVTNAVYVGTALTVQLAVGFTLTVFTIFLVPVIRDSFGWGWAFLLLAPGPLLGAWAMRTLERELEAEAEAETAPAPAAAAPVTATPVFVSPFF